MPKTVAIIQARMGSTRLPGKVLLPLAGKPLLWHVLQRAHCVHGVDEVVVATSTQSADDAIREFCADRAIHVFSGSEYDVLDRYTRAARRFSADVIMRVTGDCPLMDVGVAGEVLAGLQRERFDHFGAVAGSGARALGLPGFPEGVGVACLTRQALEDSWSEAHDPEDREHVTTYIARNPARFKSGYLVPVQDLGFFRWTVDEPEDYVFARAVFDRLHEPNPTFGMEEVLALLDAQPELAEINDMHLGREKYKHIWTELRVPEDSVRVYRP